MDTVEFKFELGATLRDVISGFTGVVMARTEYFTGCDHYGLCPRELKDGKPVDWQWIDATQLELVKEKGVVLRESRKAGTSGPFPSAPQM